MNNLEGYIKFQCNWEENQINIPDTLFEELNLYRSKLFHDKLIGVLPDGIGYGNISLRDKDNIFIISGSATGAFETLERKHYARVKKYLIKENSVECIGQTKASSESLSHAIIYETLPWVNAVIHIHDKEMWEKYMNELPTTNKEAEYGTPEMADSIRKLLLNSKWKESGIIVMGGHQDGIISFGKNLIEAYEIIDKHFKII